jgi:hypothetical protein
MNEQMQKLAEQVAGKIHWGASIVEVQEWLLHEKKISTDDADKLIQKGIQARRGEVRQRALIRVFFAVIGFVLFVAFLCAQYFGGFVVIGIPVLIMWSIGLASVGVACRSLYELVTGDSDRPM